MSAEKTDNRRRQYYIKPPFQRQFILQFLAFIVFGCAAFAVSVYLYSKQTLTTAFFESKLRVMSTSDFLLPALIVTALVVTSCVAFAAAFRLLLFSHKIAGPLYRLEKTAEAVAGGKLNLNVRLRSDDELQELARTMDGMVGDLRSRALTIKNQNEKIRDLIIQADKIPAIPKDLLEASKEAHKRLDEATSHFQV